MRHLTARSAQAALIFTLVLVSIIFTPTSAWAHSRVEVGPYVLIIGWVEEPVIVGERNAILIQVTKDEVPVTGLEGTLDIQILYAGRSFIGNLTPTQTPGYYQAKIFPTVRGQYTVQLSGSIEDMEIDETVQPEEVLSAGVLQFPEVEPDLSELQQSIDALEGQLQTAYVLAMVGVVLGVLGLIVAGMGWRRGAK